MKDILRRLINEKLQGDITQNALAEDIGISQATIHKILYTETKHTLDVLQRCANYFRVPISQFCDGEPDTTGQRTDIAPRDIVAARNQQPSYTIPADLEANVSNVIHDVRYVMLSGKPGIIVALVKNVHEFRQAVDTDNELQESKIKMDGMQTQIDALNEKVDRLTAPPTTAKQLEDSSAKGET